MFMFLRAVCDYRVPSREGSWSEDYESFCDLRLCAARVGIVKLVIVFEGHKVIPCSLFCSNFAKRPFTEDFPSTCTLFHATIITLHYNKHIFIGPLNFIWRPLSLFDTYHTLGVLRWFFTSISGGRWGPALIKSIRLGTVWNFEHSFFLVHM